MIIQCPECDSRYNVSMKTPGDVINCRCGVDFHVPALPNLAKSWHCPSCSGPVDPNQSKCSYCEAYLAFARCPACFSIAPYDEAKHCAECGESLTLPVRPISKDGTNLPCPRCDSTLNSRVVDKYLVDYCRDCGGVWLGHHQFDDLLKNQPKNSIAALGKKPTAGKTLENHAVRYLWCPECQTTMSRHNFMSKSNVIIDQCEKHGIWFDKQELAVVLDYVRSHKNAKAPRNASSTSTIIHPKEGSPLVTRDTDETFEIKEEDLSMLLEEFPNWINK